MTRWLDQAEQLTYDGEEITETVELGAGGVVVTTHRVLVFSPTGEGEAFSRVDRPNVTGIERIEAGERRFLFAGAKAGAVGAVLLVAGAVLPLDSLVGDVEFGQAGGRIGIGGVVGLLESILGVLRSIDTVLLVLGALAFLVAAAAFGWYLRTRAPQLRIERAGDEPLTLAIGERELPEGTLERLRRAIGPGV